MVLKQDIVAGGRLTFGLQPSLLALTGGLTGEQFLVFANDMFKLPKGADGQLAVLQNVLTLDLTSQVPAFLDYDTRIRGGTRENYPLSPGLYDCLIFTIPGPPERGAGVLFTTLRKHDVNKHMHYLSSIGDRFRIKIGDTHALPAQFRLE